MGDDHSRFGIPPQTTFSARLVAALRDEEGTASLEYALLLSLVAIASIGAWMGLGAKVKTTIVALTNSISQPPS